MVKKGLAIGLVVALFALAGGLALYAEGGKCSMAKVEKGWWCGKCAVAVTPDGLKDGKCAKCGDAPGECELCIVTAYTCDHCKTWSAKAGECAPCKTALVEKTVKAKVSYKCPGCGHESGAALHCPKCDKDGEKTCSESGKAPHAS